MFADDYVSTYAQRAHSYRRHVFCVTEKQREHKLGLPFLRRSNVSFWTILYVCRTRCCYLKVAMRRSHGELCFSIWVWRIKLDKTRRPRKQTLVSESGTWLWWMGQRAHNKADIPLAYSVFEIWCGKEKRNSTPMSCWTSHFRERRESMVAFYLHFEENPSSVFWNNQIYLQRNLICM